MKTELGDNEVCVGRLSAEITDDESHMPMKTKTIDQLLTERRSCYFIPPQDGDGGFIPALVIEGEKGYHMMSGNGPCAEPWRWGNTMQEANETADAMNAKRGITPTEQLKIILSSMP